MTRTVVLADTSIWIDHLARPIPKLVALLEERQIITHPFVVGEVAMGSLHQRPIVLRLLANLPQSTVAADADVRVFIERERLFGIGIGYIDCHLLASAKRRDDVCLWIRDRRLRSTADRLGLSAPSTLAP